MEANLVRENLGKRSGITDVSITKRIQEIKERISCVEDTVEEIDTSVKENSKQQKKFLSQSIQEIQDTMKKIKYKNNQNRGERRFLVQRA